MTALIASLLLLLCGLLVFLDLRSPFLWKVSLAATEFGHYFVLLPLALLITAGTDTPIAMMTSIVTAAASLILLYPSVSAFCMSRSVSRRLSALFGVSSMNGPVFSWRRLWFGTFPPAMEPERHSYVRRNDGELQLLLFRAHRAVPAPCVIIVHTGGWDSGSPAEFGMMSRHLASIGYAAACIEYRFAPAHPWPAQKEDTMDAIEFLKTNAERFGIDPSRFVLFGRSAGGQIAEAAACTAHDPTIRGCIGFYSPADLVFAYEHLLPEPDILDSRTLLHNFLNGPLEQQPERYRDASSYHHIGPAVPPMLLIHGAKDPLTWYRQSERLAKRLSEHGVRHLYIELPWGTHAFDYNFNGPGGQIGRAAVESFLAAVCTPGNHDHSGR
ncbi:MAG: alpha/beta hydrolase [Bacteroidetes bacterium]|nr:alpha/beta hydrolase [Bacteroidota bacterium]